MRIAIPADGESFCPHFGRSTAVWLCDLDPATGQIDRPRLIQRPHRGCDSLPGWLKELAVNTVIAGGIGGGAVQGLVNQGITVSAGHSGEDFAALVASYCRQPGGSTENLCHHEDHEQHHCKH